MRTIISVFAAVFIFFPGILPCFGEEKSKKDIEKPLFNWDLLWTGSWYKAVKNPDSGFPSADDLFAGGTFYNRGDFRLNVAALDISSRFLAADKRLLPPEEEDGKAGFNPGLGIYHLGSGSRVLFGVQSEYGLPARIRNVWLRSVPYLESRSPSSRDLKTEPAASDESESYLYLALPPGILPGISAYTLAALDNERNPALGAGFGLGISKAELRFEGFYTQRTLPPRTIQTWFSPSPPLPERDFRIYSLGMIFSSPWISLASDWALSETFAWGRGTYGNFALRLGNKPWRLSLAGDGAGDRFADRNGSMTGAGFRLAAKGEYFWPRSGLLRFQGTFRSSSLEDEFDRGTISAYFRPSAPTAKEKREKSFPVRFACSSIDLSRDARTPEKTLDTLNALLGFYFGPISSVFSCSLHSRSCLEEENAPLFQSRFFETFESYKISGELGWKPGIFDLRAKLGYTIREKKDPLWEPSFNVSVKPGKWGRIGLKIAYTDFPEKWNYTLSWRFEHLGKI